jgi:hypothetical protein
MAEGFVERWLRPRYVFTVLGILLVVAFFTVPEGSDGRAMLTTYRSDPQGARGIHDVLQRLGWRVERRTIGFRAPLDSDAVYALFDPPMDPSAREMAVLLDAVRRGAGLIVIPDRKGIYAESLSVARSEFVNIPMTPVSDTLLGAMPADTVTRINSMRAAMSLLSGEGVRSWHYSLEGPTPTDSESALPLPADVVPLLTVRAVRSEHVAVLGRTIGRGRVLYIADPNFLRNGVLRRGDAAVLAMRLLEWVDPAGRQPVVFDEYHQGYGRHAGLIGTIFAGLGGTPAGRTVLQLALASLILLLAASVRPIPPVARTIIERRSPLEHVGAAARLFERVGATRLAARRLVHGLRRRHPLGAAGVLGDDAYLARLRERAPSLAADAAFLAAAIRTPLPAAEFVRAGAAIDRIERTLSS